MAEKEYIERGTMLTTIQRYEDWECPATPSALKLVDMIRGRLREIPSADVVEVVRCKDCVSSRALRRNDRFEAQYADGCVYCMRNDEGVKPDDFCSYGERKEATP